MYSPQSCHKCRSHNKPKSQSVAPKESHWQKGIVATAPRAAGVVLRQASHPVRWDKFTNEDVIEDIWVMTRAQIMTKPYQIYMSEDICTHKINPNPDSQPKAIHNGQIYIKNSPLDWRASKIRGRIDCLVNSPRYKYFRETPILTKSYKNTIRSKKAREHLLLVSKPTNIQHPPPSTSMIIMSQN